MGQAVEHYHEDHQTQLSSIGPKDALVQPVKHPAHQEDSDHSSTPPNRNTSRALPSDVRMFKPTPSCIKQLAVVLELRRWSRLPHAVKSCDFHAPLQELSRVYNIMAEQSQCIIDVQCPDKVVQCSDCLLFLHSLNPSGDFICDLCTNILFIAGISDMDASCASNYPCNLGQPMPVELRSPTQEEKVDRMLHDASFESTPDLLKIERVKELLMKWHMPTQHVSCCAFHAALFALGAVIEKLRITSKCLQFSADDAVSIECPQCFRVHAQQSHVKHNTCDYWPSG